MNRGVLGASALMSSMLLFGILCAAICVVEARSVDAGVVHNLDSGLSYARIQEAIDASETQAGNTLQVEPGTYYENLVIDKALTLVGLDRDNTIIDGGGNKSVVMVETNNVRMTNFTIRNSGSNSTDSGFYLMMAWNSVIWNNTVTNCNIGIFITFGNCTLRENLVRNNHNGIYALSSFGSVVEANTVSDNAEDGVRIYYSECTVSRNDIRDNGNWGVSIFSSYNSSVVGNDLTRNKSGITVTLYAADNNLSGNNIVGGQTAIYINSASHNSVIGNNASGCSAADVLLIESSDNTFCGNWFTHTEDPVSLDEFSKNTWDNGSRGNYWSAYSGSDSNNDHVGDVAFVIDKNNVDRFPLIVKAAGFSLYPFWLEWWFWVVLGVAVAGIVSVYRMRSKSPDTLLENGEFVVRQFIGGRKLSEQEKGDGLFRAGSFSSGRWYITNRRLIYEGKTQSVSLKRSIVLPGWMKTEPDSLTHSLDRITNVEMVDEGTLYGKHVEVTFEEGSLENHVKVIMRKREEFMQTLRSQLNQLSSASTVPAPKHEEKTESVPVRTGQLEKSTETRVEESKFAAHSVKDQLVQPEKCVEQIASRVAFLKEYNARKGFLRPEQKLDYDISKRMESGKTREEAIEELYEEAKNADRPST